MNSLSRFAILPTHIIPLRETDHPFLHQAWESMIAYYDVIGIQTPWVGYLFRQAEEWVGTGGFKGGPVNGQIEIAYAVAPDREHRGIGTQICQQLTAIATEQDPLLRITARTLPEENASTNILRKNGYEKVGPIHDPEDGEVWEWEYTK